MWSTTHSWNHPVWIWESGAFRWLIKSPSCSRNQWTEEIFQASWLWTILSSTTTILYMLPDRRERLCCRIFLFGNQMPYLLPQGKLKRVYLLPNSHQFLAVPSTPLYYLNQKARMLPWMLPLADIVSEVGPEELFLQWGLYSWYWNKVLCSSGAFSCIRNVPNWHNLQLSSEITNISSHDRYLLSDCMNNC